MNYELIKKLKDAGFVTKSENVVVSEDYCENCNDRHHEYIPTLSELIEACGDKFLNLYKTGDKWTCVYPFEDERFDSCIGSTPEEAVANLWLALHDKKID